MNTKNERPSAIEQGKDLKSNNSKKLMQIRQLIGIVAVCALALVGILAIAYNAHCRNGNPRTKATDVARKALLALNDRPETIKIHAVSPADSVFGKACLTQEEKLNVSVAMMKVNEHVIKRTGGLENFDFQDRAIASLMERQMSAMSAIRSMLSPEPGDGLAEGPSNGTPTNESTVLHGKASPHTGWKVKIDYEAQSSEGHPYRAERWFFLDKDATCVVKSFEIPIV